MINCDRGIIRDVSFGRAGAVSCTKAGIFLHFPTTTTQWALTDDGIHGALAAERS